MHQARVTAQARASQLGALLTRKQQQQLQQAHLAAARSL
jgi:hypothetical protein